MNSGYTPQNDGPWTSTTGQMTSVADSPAEVRMGFIRKTYVLFMAGIFMAIVGAIVSAVTGLDLIVLKTAPISFLSLILFSFIASAMMRTPGLDYVALFGFTFLTGAIFGPVVEIFEVSHPGIAGQAAFLTIVLFGSLTAYTFLTRKDFSFMGGMLFVGLIGLVLAGLANAFLFRNAGASYWMAWVTVFLFSGFVLYDTSQIMYRYSPRAYCAAALSLFLDFLNLFMAILRILGGSRR